MSRPDKSKDRYNVLIATGIILLLVGMSLCVVGFFGIVHLYHLVFL